MIHPDLPGHQHARVVEAEHRPAKLEGVGEQVPGDRPVPLLDDLAARGGRLVYTHDPEVACSRIARDARGRFEVVDPVAALRREAA